MAWGDSLCLAEWPAKTFQVLPNWIESGALLVSIGVLGNFFAAINFLSIAKAVMAITAIDHCYKYVSFFKSARHISDQLGKGFLHTAVVSLGASTVISAQEVTRVWAMLRRASVHKSFSRRMDWFDGQTPTEILDIQLRSGIMFVSYLLVVYYFCI